MFDSIRFTIFCLSFLLYKTKKRTVAYNTMGGRQTLTMRGKFCCRIFLWPIVTCLKTLGLTGHVCSQLHRRDSGLSFAILCYEAIRPSFYTSCNPVFIAIYSHPQETLCPMIYSVQLISNAHT